MDAPRDLIDANPLKHIHRMRDYGTAAEKEAFFDNRMVSCVDKKAQKPVMTKRFPSDNLVCVKVNDMLTVKEVVIRPETDGNGRKRKRNNADWDNYYQYGAIRIRSGKIALEYAYFLRLANNGQAGNTGPATQLQALNDYTQYLCTQLNQTVTPEKPPRRSAP